MQSMQESSLLQQAAEQVVVRDDLKVSSIILTCFGALALFAGVVPPLDPFLLALGAMLSLAGLWNLTNPHPRGIVFIGVCAIAVGLYNIGYGFYEAATGRNPSVGWQVFGVWQVIWGVQSFARHRRFAHAFDGGPDTALVEQARQALRDLRKARPKQAPDVVEFIVTGFSARAARARLAPGHALCLVGNGDDVFVCAPEQLDIQVTGKAPLSKSVRAVLHAEGRSLKIQITEQHLERVHAWKSGVDLALAHAA